MKKLCIGVCILMCISFKINAQQRGQFSQYMLNYYILNPALSGTEDFIDIKAAGRFQWVGVDGAPTNYYLTAHMPIGKIHEKMRRGKKTVRPHSSVGVTFNGQAIGAMNTNSIYLSYAYVFPVSENFNISMSLQPGILFWNLDRGKLNYGDMIGDDAEANYTNQTKFDLNAGVWAYSKTVFIGFSVAQILGNPLSQLSSTITSGLDRHWYLTGGVKVKLSEDLSLIPSVLVKSLFSPALNQAFSPSSAMLDINAKLKYQGKYWGGVSYRHNDGIVLLAGMLIGNVFEIGYSYDIMTNGISARGSGSHEVVLGLRLQPKVQMICPSDFW